MPAMASLFYFYLSPLARSQLKLLVYLIYPDLDNFVNQRFGQRIIQTKLDRPFRQLVIFQLFLKFLNRSGGWEKTHMLFKGRKSQHVFSLILKTGHPVTDHLNRFRNSITYNLPESFQYGPFRFRDAV